MKGREFKGDWEELKRKIRKEFAELTNEDLKIEEGPKKGDVEETACNPAGKTRGVKKDHKSTDSD